MDLFIYNTLSNKKEKFIPIDDQEITMYVCGPTVYDKAHAGNARSVVVFDIIYRVLNFIYPKVNYVRNITDLDDKINKKAFDTNTSIKEITNKYTKLFNNDMKALSCLEPTFTPCATDHINEMIDLINKLVDRKYAYYSNNHVLFDISKYSEYCKLSNRNLDDLVQGARISVEDYKKNAGDFILWKPSTDHEPGWDSPWGYGRPGWHIECSAMSLKYLGNNFDIHGGGADLQFPHHDNEIAQAECSGNNIKYANYWIHNGFLLVNGEKMSKSLGNFITLNDVLENNHKYFGQIIRLFFLMTHYRKPINWQQDLIENATKIMNNFYNQLVEFEKNDQFKIKHQDDIDSEIKEALLDNINTPKAITRLIEISKSIKTVSDANLFVNSAKLLGLLHSDIGEYISYSDWLEAIKESIPLEIHNLTEKISIARSNKDFELADNIRNQIQDLGYKVKYTRQGIELEKI